MREVSRVDGVTRGRVPTSMEPPPPLPPVEIPRRKRKVSSFDMTVDAVVTAMLRAFVTEVGEKRAGGALRRADHEWRGTMRLMASDLIDEGISPEGYVRHVCAGIRKQRRREPYAGEVFCLKTLKAEPMQRWLASYRKGIHIDLPYYVCTPARRRLHRERAQACLARSPRTI